MNWEPWFLIIAILSLIAAVIIPFAQKKYEEYRTKRNFQFYLKKQIGLILNQLTSEKIEYFEPSVKNDPKKNFLLVSDFIKDLKNDFEKHKNSVQPRVIFALLMNIQNLCHYCYRLRLNISTINLQNLTEKTLEHGNELSKEELSKIYGLILVYESYISISQFHDNFDKIKSINRVHKKEKWISLSVAKDLLTNQERLNQDLLYLNDNEVHLKEIESIMLIVNRETRKYFDYDKMKSKRRRI